MKTIRYKLAAAWMLAALTTFAVSGTLMAEDAGVVRLSDFDAAVAGDYEDSDVVVRGASNMRQRNIQASHALRQMFKGRDTGCDECLPATAYCAPEACAAPGDCCPTGDGCCSTSGDGYGMSGYGGACQVCGGQGCSACRGRHGRLGRNDCNSGACRDGHCMGSCLRQQCAMHRARNRYASNAICQYLHCNFGCLVHDGNGGVGSPLFGHYEIVYPVNPGYADGRDGQVYAAQGYGGAISVPLAPVVRQAYNYSWGIPSSRLTPVSNTTP